MCAFRSVNRMTDARSESRSSSSGPIRCTYRHLPIGRTVHVSENTDSADWPVIDLSLCRGHLPLENIVPYWGNKMKYGSGVRIKGFSEGMWEIQNTPGVGSKLKVSVSDIRAEGSLCPCLICRHHKLIFLQSFLH